MADVPSIEAGKETGRVVEERRKDEKKTGGTRRKKDSAGKKKTTPRRKKRILAQKKLQINAIKLKKAEKRQWQKRPGQNKRSNE